jgi:hypothetical protein
MTRRLNDAIEIWLLIEPRHRLSELRAPLEGPTDGLRKIMHANLERVFGEHDASRAHRSHP